jgi:hypothetical protein
MIANIRRFGRLGNCLFMYSHLIAFAEQEGRRIFNPIFLDFSKDFQWLGNRSAGCYIPSSSTEPDIEPRLSVLRLKKVLGVIPTVRFWDDRDVIFDEEDENDPRVRIMRESNAVIYEGWKLRSHISIRSIMPVLRGLFLPTEEVRHTVNRRLKEARNRADVVVGVHIRWEDYRNTANFFSLAEYIDRIRQLETLLAQTRVSFICVSPEELTIEDLPESCYVPERSGPVQDLYTLADCDYIVGPPSTYSGWASFYGGKPLFKMEHEAKIKSLSDAQIVLW